MFSPFQCEGADFLVIAIQKSGLFHSKQDITSELNLKKQKPFEKCEWKYENQRKLPLTVKESCEPR